MFLLKEFFKLTRFEHAIMLAFAVLIAETILLGSFPPLDQVLLFSLLVPIFSEMGSFALNDYFDIETDRLNKKTERPLVKGTLSPRFALYFSITALLLSTAFAFLINSTVFVIALIFNILAIVYNYRLKDLPLVGNIYIALTMAIPFIFGNFVVSQTLSQTAIVLASLGFVAGLAREIIKSVQDMEGDIRGRGSKTLPVIIGKKPSIYTSILLYLLFIPLTAAPFLFGLEFSVLPAILVILADVLILAICYKITKDDFKFARNVSLLSFLLGMLGLWLAAL